MSTDNENVKKYIEFANDLKNSEEQVQEQYKKLTEHEKCLAISIQISQLDAFKNRR